MLGARRPYVVVIPACVRSITRYLAKAAAISPVRTGFVLSVRFTGAKQLQAHAGFSVDLQDNLTIELALGGRR